MTKEDGMSDIFQATLEFVVFVSLGDEKRLNFPFLTCPCFAISLRKAGSVLFPIPRRVKAGATGAGGLGYLSSNSTN